MGSLVLLVIILTAGFAAERVAPYAYDEIDLNNPAQAPTTEGKHYFGTDQLGRDYFSRVLFGIQTSARVAFIVAFLSTVIGVIIGALAGYFGGWRSGQPPDANHRPVLDAAGPGRAARGFGLSRQDRHIAWP